MTKEPRLPWFWDQRFFFSYNDSSEWFSFSGNAIELILVRALVWRPQLLTFCLFSFLLQSVLAREGQELDLTVTYLVGYFVGILWILIIFYYYYYCYYYCFANIIALLETHSFSNFFWFVHLNWIFIILYFCSLKLTLISLFGTATISTTAKINWYRLQW